MDGRRWKWITDGGRSWKWLRMAQGSSGDGARPASVAFAASDGAMPGAAAHRRYDDTIASPNHGAHQSEHPRDGVAGTGSSYGSVRMAPDHAQELSQREYLFLSYFRALPITPN